jgi:alpha 1,3-glucosidase
MVTIIDPHIKRDETYEIHREAKAKDFYIKDANGNDFEGMYSLSLFF